MILCNSKQSDLGMETIGMSAILLILTFYGQIRPITHPGLSWTGPHILGNPSVLSKQDEWPLWLNPVSSSRCSSHLLSCLYDPWNEISFKVLVGLIFCGYS